MAMNVSPVDLYKRFRKRPDAGLISLCFIVITLYAGGLAWDAISFHNLSASAHLVAAKAACRGLQDCKGGDLFDAKRHLEAIPASSPESAEATSMLQEVRTAIRANEKAEQERQRAAALFKCSASTTNQPIMSFDGGSTWMWDDGRCARIFQKERDRSAHNSSYFPTTLRVDTDIDSSWLPNEQRDCISYPDGTGQIATVTCNGDNTRHPHNIPIKFWGGVKRNVASDWKCTLTDSEVVYKAVD